MAKFWYILSHIFAITEATIPHRPVTAATSLSRPVNNTSNPINIYQNASSCCPGELGTGYVAPWLIIPISQSQPTTPFGTIYSPTITPNDLCTIFILAIPSSVGNKTCTLEFLFPEQDQLETSSYHISGPGNFDFAGYIDAIEITPNTTWQSQEGLGTHELPPTNWQPGNKYVLYEGPCALDAGNVVGGRVCSKDTSLDFFQDYNECPIGLWITLS
ncbi:MAG: hypothetical protein M1820_003076 [Bogoriella megaspora]|nr:MAG: hypothetical protein M1820_003076 [Bogoriella megaspora]